VSLLHTPTVPTSTSPLHSCDIITRGVQFMSSGVPRLVITAATCSTACSTTRWSRSPVAAYGQLRD